MADEVTDSTGLGGLSESGLDDTSLASLDDTTGLTGPLEEVTSLNTMRLPPFPTEAFMKVMEGLNKFNSWTVYPDDLATCITSTTQILRSGCRLPPAERGMISKLLREAIPSSFEKAVEDPCQSRWSDDVQSDILECGMKLVSLIVQRLQELVRLEGAAEQTEQTVAVEEDLAALYDAWHKLCDPQTPFHVRTKELDLPVGKVEEFALEHAVPSSPLGSHPSPSDSSTSVEEILQPEHTWLANLLNAFGAQGGFELVCKVLQMPCTSYMLVDTLLAPILKALSFLTKPARASFVEPLAVVLNRMEAQLGINPELLTDGGKDRMFQSVSGALLRINKLLDVAVNPQAADQQVGHVQRQFVLRLLGQSSFSKHLSAVRETNTLLKRAVELRDIDNGHSIKVNVDWLRENDIVKQLLRANLHQKQYVDQVQKVLKNLTIEGGLQEDHLELLWNLTEKVDTFEAVKNNVYAMLGELAQDFDGNQMDLLFNKFEACSGLASRQTDTMKVMNLVQQLAVSDSKGAMASRILGLLWEMVMNPEAPPELSRSPTLVDSICHYGWAHAWPYMQRCVDKVAANDNAPTALHTLRRLCERLPQDVVRQGGVLSQETLQMLESDCHLQEVVVSSFEAFMADVVEAEHKDPHAHSTAEGNHRLRFQMVEYVQFLHSFVRSQGTVLPVNVYERLWHCWLERPRTPWVLELGFQWFASCAACMRAADAAYLLQGKMMDLDPLTSAPDAWHCFLTYFRQVGVAEGKLVAKPAEEKLERGGLFEPFLTDSLELTGMPCMWSMALRGEHGEVLQEAAAALVHLHLHLGPQLQQQAPSVRHSFVAILVEKLTQAHAGVKVVADASSLPGALQRRNLSMQTARCLALLQTFISKCQKRTMPLRLAHAASYQGRELRLEVQVQGGAKLAGQQRLRTSVCCNAYVGQLRRQIASQIGHPASQVRMLHGGKELNSDSTLVQEERVADGNVLQVMTTPVVLEYTQLPKDAAAYEQSSPACMLAKQEAMYSMLLEIADDSPFPLARMNASRLLGMLPTCHSISTTLHAALVQKDAAAQLSTILQMSSSGKRTGRAWLLYLIEAICGVLFPAVADAQAEPPAELLQQSFVRSGCIQALLDAVGAVTAQPASSDPAHFLPNSDILRNVNCTCLELILHLNPIIKAITAAPSESPSVSTSATPMQVSPCATPRQHSTEASDQADQQPGPASSQPALPSVSSPETDMLIKMAVFFVRLAHAVTCFWASPSPPGLPWEHAIMGDKDVAMHQEAACAIKDLLDTHPALLSHLLPAGHPFAEGFRSILEVDLFTPRHDLVRARTARLAERLAKTPEGHAWVLQMLLGCCSTADRFMYTCREFYDVLCHLLHAPGSAPPRDHLQAMLASMADQMASCRPADALDLRLEGKLLLTAALRRALSRHSLEDTRFAASGPLVVRLLTEFLFPEAFAEAELWRLPEQSMAALDPDLMFAAMNPRCMTPSSRKAAFELLQELILYDASNLSQVVALLMDLHYDLDRPGILGHWQWNAAPPNIVRNVEGFVGLRNGSATCYMNAVFQQLFMVPGVRTALLSEPEQPAVARKDSVFYHMQSTFAHLALSRQQSFRPVGIWHAFKDYDGEPVDVREHQDAQEFLTRLQDLLDQHQRDCKRQPIMQAQFGGKLTTQIVCRSVPYRSEKDEDFVQVGLDVRGKHDLEESLDFYVQSELMEGENQYLCEEAGKKVDAVKGICFKELPNTLCIHLKRFEYDYEQMTRWKIKDRFEFPQDLNMYKYTKAAADAREAAEAAGGDAAQASADPEYAYELRGIVVHSGTANAGHYYSYIKVRQEPGLSCGGQWYCFDDVSVDPWDIANLERDCFGGKHIPETGYYSSKMQEIERPNSAYLLFYDRVAASPGSSAQEATSTAEVAADSAGSSRIAAVPIPAVELSVPSIFQDVMSSNFRTMSRTHLLDKDYFTFMRHLFDADSRAASHKVRRTGATSSPSSRSQSSMQTVPATSMDVSDSRSNTSAETLPAAMPAIALMPTVSDRSAASPGRKILDLCLHFLFRVLMRSHTTLRSDLASWRHVLHNTLEHDSYARRRVLEVAAAHDMPNEAPYDDTETLDFGTTYLVRSDQPDVRLCMGQLLSQALTLAALHDDGTPASGAEPPEAGSSAAACDALLSSLRKGIRTEQAGYGHPSPGSYSKHTPPNMDAFPVLAEYASMGMQQALHLVRLSFLQVALKGAEMGHDAVRLCDATAHDMVACFQLLSFVGRRWEADEAVPNPFRMEAPGPSIKPELRPKLLQRGVTSTLLTPPYVQDPACRILLKFLQWQQSSCSSTVVHEVLDYLLSDNEAYLHPMDLADVLCIRDTLMPLRMLTLMRGPGGPRTRTPHGLAIAVMQQSMTALRRFTILKFIVALADTHYEVEQAVLSQSCPWNILCDWLERQHPSEVLYELPRAAFSSPTHGYRHVLHTLQRWSQSVGEHIAVDADDSEAEGLEAEDDAVDDAAAAEAASP